MRAHAQARDYIKTREVCQVANLKESEIERSLVRRVRESGAGEQVKHHSFPRPPLPMHDIFPGGIRTNGGHLCIKYSQNGKNAAAGEFNDTTRA